MSKNEDRRVPEVRFKGFTDDWEQRKLDEVVNVYDGTHQTPNYQQTGIMFLSVEDISNLQSKKFISKEDFKRNFKVTPKKGDILMTRIGDVGTPNVVTSTVPIAFYVSLALLKPKSVDSYFICDSIQSPIVQSKIHKRTLTTAIPQKINKDEIGNVEIKLPSNQEEQSKIGSLFQQVDHLITLQHKKLKQLKLLKKALLQNLFTDDKYPKIRFNGYSDPWEQRKLEQLGKIITGNTPKTSQTENYSVDGIPWITPTDIHGSYTNRSIRNLSNIGQQKARIVPAKSLLITCIASIGKNTLVLQKSGFNQQINALIPCDNDPYFLLARSATWSQRMISLAGQTAMPIINKRTFSNIITNIPSLKEQEKIGNFFTKLNYLISFQQKELNQYTLLKKFLLQNLFI